MKLGTLACKSAYRHVLSNERVAVPTFDSFLTRFVYYR